MKITILGPHTPLRDSLFNERLVPSSRMKEMVDVITFSHNIPLFSFRKHNTHCPKPENIEINAIVNSINPFNW